MCSVRWWLQATFFLYRKGENRIDLPALHIIKRRKKEVMIVSTLLPFLFLYQIVSLQFPLKKKRLILPRSSACHSALDQQDLFSRVGQRFYYIPMLVRNQVFVLRKFCPERRKTKPEQSVHHPWQRSMPPQQSYPSRWSTKVVMQIGAPKSIHRKFILVFHF